MQGSRTRPANLLAPVVDFVFGPRTGLFIIAAVVLTALLVVPLLALDSPEDASRNPSGEVFDLQDEIDERFTSLIHPATYILEARNGDVLTRDALLELYQNTQKLLAADAKGELAPDDLPSQPYLYRTFDLDANRPVVGVTTLADQVQLALAAGPVPGLTLETATDDQVKVALHFIFSLPQTQGLKDALSVESSSERRVVGGVEIDYWRSPALFFNVLADNEALGGGSVGGGGVNTGDSTLDKEEFNRNVQTILRGEERFSQLWGIAIDQNLEIEDEGQTAGLFIMFTVVGSLIVVGISLRSYWALALTGAGLGALMIWLKGISRLVGIKGGLEIDLIVPIAMIALGVDFAVHAMRRYQEERAEGYPPRRALQVGMAGVSIALVLALCSDAIAFLSNVSSGIESVVHFGLAAGIAVTSSFLVLGVIVPLALMRIDDIRGAGRQPASLIANAGIAKAGIANAGRLAAAAGMAVLTGFGVLFLVAGFVLPGALFLAATVVVFLLAPVLVMRWRRRNDVPEPDAPDPSPSPVGGGSSGPGGDTPFVAALMWLARWRLVVILVTAIITSGAVVLATNLSPAFDVKDFFDNGSDFVVSLDKLDTHIAERGGEGGVVYIRGDLTEPAAVEALRQFAAGLAENPYVGIDSDGNPALFEPNLLTLLERVTGSEYARGRVEAATGVAITDLDGNGIPDSRDQLRAVYEHISQNGVPLNEGTQVFDAGQVRETLSYNPPGGPSADSSKNAEHVTRLIAGIPGTREQSVVTAARLALEADLEPLRLSPGISKAALTGAPFVREAQLNATTDTLQRSLPIAAAATLVLLLFTMRSLRYAVVTIIPIGLVVAWLYALMYIFGFSLNFVTATIGAVSIGVGIDYSIHLTQRFREEMGRSPNKTQALRQAANGAGVALVASAVSSIAGFTILGFAPMPMFSAFGYLTALMVFLALVASLVVLPSLLLMVTPEGEAE